MKFIPAIMIIPVVVILISEVLFKIENFIFIGGAVALAPAHQHYRNYDDEEMQNVHVEYIDRRCTRSA